MSCSSEKYFPQICGIRIALGGLLVRCSGPRHSRLDHGLALPGRAVRACRPDGGQATAERQQQVIDDLAAAGRMAIEGRKGTARGWGRNFGRTLVLFFPEGRPRSSGTPTGAGDGFFLPQKVGHGCGELLVRTCSGPAERASIWSSLMGQGRGIAGATARSYFWLWVVFLKHSGPSCPGP